MEKTVVKAFRLVETLAKSERPLGVSQLSQTLGLTKSNVHRLLETLRFLGYVARHDGGTYSLSLELWRVGSSVLSRIDIKERATPYLQEMMERTGETARLTVFVNDQGVCIQQVQSTNPVGVLTKVGGTLSPYCSATGKALLAYQPQDVLERIESSLVKHTDRTLDTPQALQAELERIRHRGFAVNAGEWREDVSGVAAPVWDGEGRVVAALGISGPATRLTETALETLGPLVRTLGLRLSADLGCPLRGPERLSA